MEGRSQQRQTLLFPFRFPTTRQSFEIKGADDGVRGPWCVEGRTRASPGMIVSQASQALLLALLGRPSAMRISITLSDRGKPLSLYAAKSNGSCRSMHDYYSAPSSSTQLSQSLF